MREIFDVKGEYRLRNYVTLPTGIVKLLWDSGWRKNVITNNGRTALLSRWNPNSSQNAPTYVGVGTGTGQPTLTDTALTSAVMKAISSVVVSPSTWSVTYTALFTAAEINGKTEIGLFDAQTGGTLLTRSLFANALQIPGGSVSLDYRLSMKSMSIVNGWATADYSDVFKVAMPSASLPVVGVTEVDTSNGFAAKTTEAAVHTTACTYWQSASTLYIHPSDGALGTHTYLVTFGG